MLASSTIVDTALAITALELIVLLVWCRGVFATKALLANLCAGLFLMLAVRVALAGAEWPWLAACLAAAGAAHVVDLAARWRQPES